MNGSPEADKRPLERYRDYLRLLARTQIGTLLQAKMDASDAAQQAILQAHAARAQLHGKTEAELLGWLRVILANVLAEAARRFDTAARDVKRERSLEAELDQSSSRLECLLAADQTSPSERAVHVEDLVRLSAALAQLPGDQCRAVELRYLKDLSVAEVAELMGRTHAAVVGLLFRGLRSLRELLREGGEG